MKKILIIEDDSSTLDILAFILANSGFEPHVSENPKPIEEVIDLNPDLLILDQVMGKHLGSDFCIELKQNRLTKHIPVILCSVVDNLPQLALHCGADAHITKPFDMRDLISEVNRLLDMPEQEYV